jgi:NAD(P)H-hydrate epimerase
MKLAMQRSLSREQVRSIDQIAIDEFGMLGLVLMENAGRSVADRFMQLCPERKLVTIMSGPGNNGGDGFVIARHLQNQGYPVQVWLCAENIFRAPKISADSQANFDIWLKSSNIFYRVETGLGKWHPQLSRFFSDEIFQNDGWIIDCLFGTGLTRAISEPLDELIGCINASQRPVLAVDLPSGLDCDTGVPLGPTIRAKATATFVATKLGFSQEGASNWTGEVTVIDIGVPRLLLQRFGLVEES